MKSKFIINELWVLSVSGAFQRAHIYALNTTENAKKEFKSELKVYLEQLVQAQYFKEITEENHLANIYALSAFSKKFSSILRNGKINFGVSQKILNLFLKYLWCLKLIPTPPHFPVDRMIQDKLNKVAKATSIQSRKIEPWTQIKDEKKYLEVIQFAKTIKNEVTAYKDLSLAELELTLFTRRS